MRRCLRYSPRLLVRPESTDFIGCFPSRIRRCQQHKNKIVAIVPSKRSNNSSTHWILYGLKRTKNAAAIIIRRDVGQIPQPQTADSSPVVLSMNARDDNKDTGRATWRIVRGARTGSKWTAQTIVSLLWGTLRDSADTHHSFIYLFIYFKRARESD